MVYIDCGYGNPEDYNSDFASQLQAELEEMNEYQDYVIGMTCWGEFVKASDIFGKGV